MATIASSSTPLLHHLLRHPRQTSSFRMFFRPFCVSTLTHKANQRLEPRSRSFLPSLESPLPPHPPSSSSSSISVSRSLSPLFVSKSYSSVHEPELREGDEDEENVSLSALSGENDDNEDEYKDRLDPALLSLVESSDLDISEAVTEGSSGDKEERTAKPRNSALKLSVKEKKELASYAHSLGKKLKCQLVGKSGVTDTVVSSFVETLEKNESLVHAQVKIHRTCPGELEDVVQHLEEATGSVVVGQIGWTVIVYRPSLTKMRAEEKRKESMKRTTKFSPASPKKDYAARKEYVARSSRRGRRGVSRVAMA